MIVSLIALKLLVERKIKKKLLIKIMWNNNEKVTLFIPHRMNINSFLYYDSKGYQFYDNEGKIIEDDIPCVLLDEDFVDGKVKLSESKSGKILFQNQPLSEEDILFLKNYS